MNPYVTEKISFKKLGDTDLLSRFGKLVQTERKISHLVLECIAEIDLRKLYLERAYSSLHDFLVRGHGYSPSSAMRRIESARLLQVIPEIAQKIEEGALNLSQISMVSQAVRQAQTTATEQNGSGDKVKISVAQTKELLSKIEYSTQHQTQQIIAQEFDFPIIQNETQRVHKDGSVTLTITFSKEGMEALKEAADLIAHAVPDKKWSKAIAYLAEKEIKQRTEIKRTVKNTNQMKSDTNIKTSNTIDFDGPTLNTTRKSIRPILKRIIFQKNQCCQFKDPITQKICGGTRFLQIDHIQPVWAGGTNDPANLRILCAQHNQLKYRKENSQKSVNQNLHP